MDLYSTSTIVHYFGFLCQQLKVKKKGGRDTAFLFIGYLEFFRHQLPFLVLFQYQRASSNLIRLQ